MLKISKFMLAVVSTAALAACGGGTTSTIPAPVIVSTANLVAPVTASIVPAVVNTPFTFASGVPDFGTTAETTLTFTSTGDTPAFSIGSGGAVATGTTTFGSCIFIITASTFPTAQLATGKVVRADTCTLNVGTLGGAANGSSSRRDVSLAFRTVISGALNLPVTINPDGRIVLNNIQIGLSRVSAVTGS